MFASRSNPSACFIGCMQPKGDRKSPFFIHINSNHKPVLPWKLNFQNAQQVLTYL